MRGLTAVAAALVGWQTCLPLIAAAPTTSTTAPKAPTTAQQRRTSSADAQKLLQSAIIELTKEAETAFRTGGDLPRRDSTYFKEKPPGDLTPQAITTALRRNLAGDPRVAAYVKHQLLSAIPSPPDEKTAAELLQAYRAAPPPFPRPGMSEAERDELDRLHRNAREADEAQLSEQLDAIRERADAQNTTILAYRDALLAKLPPSYDAIAAGFEDAVARMQAGIDPADHLKNVCKIIPVWATAGAPADQLRNMSRAIAQLQKRKGPPYYNSIAWSESRRKFEFRTREASMSGAKSQLDDARELIDEQVQRPTAPLKLKEEK